MVGYLHKDYAQSLSEHGNIIRLPHSKGWILKRKIPDFDYFDGMGIYPLFFCENWNNLSEDLKEIENDLVCFTMVTDPFGKFNKSILKEEFNDVFFPFKEHFVIDLSKPLEQIISIHHRRNIKKALKKVIVERCESPVTVSKEWVKLYENLINIHHIKGIPAFSKSALVKQLGVPGVIVFRGIYNDKTVGMLIWYVNNQIGYYHLGASSMLGYSLKASFALFWESINYFSSKGLEWINLGAGAGSDCNGTAGLTRFKKGWSSEIKIAFFCGKIFCKRRYHEISIKNGYNSEKYFPSYRLGEFS